MDLVPSASVISYPQSCPFSSWIATSARSLMGVLGGVYVLSNASDSRFGFVMKSSLLDASRDARALCSLPMGCDEKVASYFSSGEWCFVS